MLPSNLWPRLKDSGMLVFRPDRGWETKTDGSSTARTFGPGTTCRGRAVLLCGARSRDAHPVPDDIDGRRWQAGSADRLAGAAQRGNRAARAAALSPAWGGRRPASATAGSADGGADHLAGGVATGDRPGPTHGRRA